MDVVGAGISTPNYLLELQAEVGRVQQRLHDLCDRTEQERQERLFLEHGRNASVFIDRTTDRSSLSTNWRTSVKPFATKWLTFVASMPFSRARLRNEFGTKRIYWRFLSVAVACARGRDPVLMVRAGTTNIKRRMRTHPARRLDRVRIAFAM